MGHGSFRKLGVPYFGVLIIRMLYYLGYYIRVPYFRKLQRVKCQGGKSQEKAEASTIGSYYRSLCYFGGFLIFFEKWTPQPYSNLRRPLYYTTPKQPKRPPPTRPWVAKATTAHIWTEAPSACGCREGSQKRCSSRHEASFVSDPWASKQPKSLI